MRSPLVRSGQKGLSRLVRRTRLPSTSRIASPASGISRLAIGFNIGYERALFRRSHAPFAARSGCRRRLWSRRGGQARCAGGQRRSARGAGGAGRDRHRRDRDGYEHQPLRRLLPVRLRQLAQADRDPRRQVVVVPRLLGDRGAQRGRDAQDPRGGVEGAGCRRSTPTRSAGFYASCMDEAGIEASAPTQLKQQLKRDRR